MKKLLLITHNQFGYQVSSYKYACILKDYFDVSYLCFDYGKDKVVEKGIRVIYVSKTGNKFIQFLRLVSEIKIEQKKEYDIVLLKYFEFCSVLKLFFKSRVILDIRTGKVSNNEFKNIVFNALIRFDSLFYKNKMILSESLRDYFCFKPGKIFVLPLGSDIISSQNKTFDNFHLIYVGSFNNRSIDKTIIGFSEFLKKNVDPKKVSYTIIGFGALDTIAGLKKLISDLELNEIISYEGIVPYKKLNVFFNACNFGISYIPMTPYYDNQPATKTYEYLLSGMPVIATATYENRIIINDENGILINDDANSVANGLYELYCKRHSFASDRIRTPMLNYTWSNIIRNKLLPYIDKI